MKRVLHRCFIFFGAPGMMLSGCASHSHRFGPVGAGAENSGRRYANEAFYPIESGRTGVANGNLRLRSEGVVDLRAKGEKTRLPALHMKATIVSAQDGDAGAKAGLAADASGAPSGSAAWIFNPKDLAVIFPDQGRAVAVAVRPGGLDPVQIAPGESKQVDLYFMLPPKNEAGIAEFDVQWKLKAGAREISELTSFARLTERTENTYPYYGLGVGSGLWWGGSPRYYVPSAPPIRVRR